MDLDDISLLNASWYLRLSTSFWNRASSHSSVGSPDSGAASLLLQSREEGDTHVTPGNPQGPWA